MAGIIPIALRYGISDERTWTMTYGELTAEIEAHRKRHDEERRFFDILNGKFCSVFASHHGVESCPADYMITGIDNADPLPKTPDDIQDRAFISLSKASLGGSS